MHTYLEVINLFNCGTLEVTCGWSTYSTHIISLTSHNHLNILVLCLNSMMIKWQQLLDEMAQDPV